MLLSKTKKSLMTIIVGTVKLYTKDSIKELVELSKIEENAFA